MATTPPVQQDPQSQQDGNLSGVVAATLAAGGAVVAGLAPAAAAVVPAVGLALTAKQIADLAAAMIKRTQVFMTARAGQVAVELSRAITTAHPELEPSRVEALVREEMKREVAFRRKMTARLAADIPKALQISDPARRRDELRRILEREQRYLALREEAMSDRALMAAEHDVVRGLSPKGAFWKLSPDVLKHTPDCVALGERWWPWAVVDAVGGPPRHPGCRCQLLTEDEAVSLGYIEKGYADKVDVKDALKRAKKGLRDAQAVLEAVSGAEWEAWLEHLQEAAALKGAMVALYPSNRTAAALARIGDEPTNQIHLTLAFLGPDATALEGDRAAITDAVRKAAASSSPIKGVVGGVGQFRGDGDGVQPQIALADVPGLDELRAALTRALRANKVGQVDSHGFTPHLTLRYAKPGESLPKMPPALPLEFDRVHLVWGGQKTAFKLGGGLEEAFDPSQPRDAEGKWTTLYTGMSAAAARRVARTGFTRQVWATTDRNEALGYADDDERGLVSFKAAPKNPLRFEGHWPAESVQGRDELIKQAVAAGHDALIVKYPADTRDPTAPLAEREWWVIPNVKTILHIDEAFDPREPRDPHGRWSGAGRTLERVIAEHPKADISAWERDWGITLSIIRVAREDRRQGIAGEAMRAILEYADEKGKPVFLTPGDDFRERGDMSKAKLAAWYKRLGFVRNLGRNKDFASTEAMVRRPGKLSEAYVEAQHPRGRTGKWVAKAIAAAGVKGVDVRKAFGYGSASPSHAKRAEYRMQATEAILSSGTAVRDAVLLLPPDTEQRESLLKQLAVGDTRRAFKEFGETPVADLEVLSGIYVKTHPVSGQANTQMASRVLTMGSTSVTGDFRHELGHAIRASFGGAGGPTAHTPLTSYVAERHTETMKRRAESIAAGLPKPQTHAQWEEQIGVIDPRGFDSWDEDFAEQYRAYQKAVYQARHPEASDYNPEALELYRKRHPKWADLWDAWYTAQLAGRFQEPAVQTALHEADVLMEAYDRRYPKGTKEGGRFMPRVGASPHLSLLKRHMLSHLFPELPAVPRGMKGRGEHRVLAGQRVFVPKEREFERKLGGRIFRSPAGSTSVYTTPAAGQGRLFGKKEPLPVEDLERLRGEENTRLDAIIAHGLAAHEQGTPPVEVGAPGWMTDARLREAGFLETKAGDSFRGLVFDYLAPDGVSKLRVSYDKQGSAVTEAVWEPAEAREVRQLTRPPKTMEEFTDDLYAYAHDMGREVGRTVTVNRITALPVESNSDHAGEHRWGGHILLGSEVPQDIFEAAVARKRTGKLTGPQKQRVWAATQAGMHEAIHGVNPSPKEVYGDGPNMVLEEAITEEIANVETAKKLRAQGQDDVVQWAADNPTNSKRLGTYPSYRHALDRVLNDAGVEPRYREGYLRNMKFRAAPGDRIEALAADVQRNLGLATVEDAEARVVKTLNEVGKPSSESLAGDFDFVPVLAIPAEPSRFDDRFEIGGYPLELGDTVSTLVWDAPSRDEFAKVGKVTALNELAGGGWSADVAYSDGTFNHAVLPSQIAAVEGQTYDRVNFGTGDEAEINGATIRAGDSIEYGPLANDHGNTTNATVSSVIRDRNPVDPSPNAWVIEATHEDGTRVVLTHERTNGHLHKTAGADDVPPQAGTAKPLTLNQKADVSAAYTTTPGSQVVATQNIVTTERPSAKAVRDETQRLRGMGEQKPPLLTVRRADGKHELLERPEALEAARATGLTHLPVREAALPRATALRMIDEAAEHRRQQMSTHGTNDHDRGLLAGLQRAHEIVRAGGGQADIAADSAAHRAAQGRMGDYEEGYHVGLRQAWHEVDSAIRQAHLSAYAYRTPRGSEERWMAGVNAARGQASPGGLWGWFHKKQGDEGESREPLNPMLLPVGGNEGVAAEDADGVRWYLRRRPGDMKLQAKRHFGDAWKAYAGDPSELEVVKSVKSSAGGSTPAAPPAAFLERPFEPHLLKATGPNRRALLRDSEGKEYRAEWAKEQGMIFLDPKSPSGFTQTAKPIKVEDLPHGLTLTGFAAEQSYLPPPPPKPLTDDGGQVTTTKPAGGSNGAMFATDKAGTEWLVKTYRGNEDRVATELLANSIYRELGIRVPEAGELQFGGKVALGYPLLEGKEQKWDAPNAELGEGFMADALLANWDVVGLAQDNVLWDPDGHPFRVDQGGTLSFRAMGSPKPYGPIPTEVWTMNQPGGQAFGTMEISDESKRAGAEAIASALTPERIDALVDAAPYKDGKMREAVRQALHSRVAWMGDYAKGLVSEPRPMSGDHAAITLASAQAGMDLSPEQHLAATAWAEGWHTVVNDGLRTKSAVEKSKEQRFLEQTMGTLTRAKETKLEEPLEAWLTLPKTTLPAGGPGAIVGKTLSDPGFTNLGLADPGGERRVRLLVPAGKSVLYLRGLPDTPIPADAPDLVLPRGSRIKIMSQANGVLDGVVV